MKHILSFLFLLLVITPAKAQDYIFLLKGDTINAKVILLSKTDLQYITSNSLDTSLLEKSLIEKIVYKNGTIVNLNKNQKHLYTLGNLGYDSLYSLGYDDAKHHYGRYKPAAAGTFITTLFSPVLGLIPAVSCASTKPQNNNLNFPNMELAKNQSYYLGYTESASKIKRKKVWEGYAGGCLAYVLLVAVLVSLQ